MKVKDNMKKIFKNKAYNERNFPKINIKLMLDSCTRRQTFNKTSESVSIYPLKLTPTSFSNFLAAFVCLVHLGAGLPDDIVVFFCLTISVSLLSSTATDKTYR